MSFLYFNSCAWLNVFVVFSPTVYTRLAAAFNMLGIYIAPIPVAIIIKAKVIIIFFYAFLSFYQIPRKKCL